MVKKTIIAVSLACGLALSALAQQAATVVLRSGERISGELVDYNASGVLMKVGAQDRSFPRGDVSSVELNGRALTADQQNKVNAGQSFVVLNDGQTIEGSLYDISGASPLKISIDSPGGRREFNGTDVAAIYFGGPATPGAVATSGVQSASIPSGAIVVAGNQQWTPTNITVKSGEMLRFQSSGEVRFTADPNDRAQPAGSLDQKRVSGAPIPSAFAGALIGRVNAGAPFAIGDQTQVKMPASGQLFIGVNDDNVSDNAGQFNVVISR